MTQRVEVLRYLLRIEYERLEVARRIEKERRIVFPETSVIIRDIERLVDAIEGKGSSAATEADEAIQAVLDSMG